MIHVTIIIIIIITVMIIIVIIVISSNNYDYKQTRKRNLKVYREGTSRSSQLALAPFSVIRYMAR